MIDIPEEPPDAAVSFGAYGLAVAADAMNVPIQAEARGPLARAVLEAAWPHLNGLDPPDDTHP